MSACPQCEGKGLVPTGLGREVVPCPACLDATPKPTPVEVDVIAFCMGLEARRREGVYRILHRPPAEGRAA